jgi:L,D-peptidoglycan transpeptidase YkuD (ErfK/YbiS/YcfS/YnhG family)
MRVRLSAVAVLATAVTGCAAAGTSAAAVSGATPDATKATGSAGSTTAGSAAGSTLPDRLRGVKDARQLLVATATRYGTSYATLRGYRYGHGHWHHVFGPWRARIGYNGFARRGDKREGDLRTPSGSFRLPFAFGAAPNPGAHVRYRRALSTSRWDDDSASGNYNRWVDIRRGYPGRSPEYLRTFPVYRYGVVIGYNRARTPGIGSAIFLHVTDDNWTTGCVAIARHRVVRVLRWLRPGLRPRIIMGTTAAVTK